MIEKIVLRSTKEEAEPRYRYRVTETWGDAPEAVRQAVGQSETYLLYDSYMGAAKTETIVDLQTGRLTGGWRMRYAGKRW